LAGVKGWARGHAPKLCIGNDNTTTPPRSPLSSAVINESTRGFHYFNGRVLSDTTHRVNSTGDTFLHRRDGRALSPLSLSTMEK